MFKSTLDPVERVLKDAKIPREKVDDIVLVGGSTRIPKIQSLVSEYFGGRQLNKSINPDEAVAYGAAVQAAVLTGQTSDKTQDLVLLDVAPLSLGVAMQGDIFGVVVPRNTPIPTTKSRTFTTVEDNQTTVTFPVYVLEYFPPVTRLIHLTGTRGRGRNVVITGCLENSSLMGFLRCFGDRLNLSPLSKSMQTAFSKSLHRIVPPVARPRSVRTLALIHNGRLLMPTCSLGITNSVGRLSSAEIEQMVKDAEQFKQADKDFSARHEAKSDLEAYIHQVENTITSPEIGMKLKRGAKAQVEAELARALEKLEIEDSTADELRKAQLGIKRALQKATAGMR